MLVHVEGGLVEHAGAPDTEDVVAPCCVNSCMAAVWPHLLAASEAADRKDRGTASDELRAAARVLLEIATALK